jgi:hypothetical protein
MKAMSPQEAAGSRLNLRQKMEVYIDAAWSGTTHPAWQLIGERLTPTQALSRYETYRRAAHAWVVLKAVAEDGRVFDIATLDRAVQLARSRP